MRTNFLCGLLIWMLMGVAGIFRADAAPLRVIFDTDIDSDNDDVTAVAMLHALADEGEVEILAMGVISGNPWSPACLDALNTWHGRPDIPIGVYKGKEIGSHSKYAQVVAVRCPSDVGRAEKVPDVVGVYRRVLAGESDGAVTLIAVGEMNNLVDVLNSKPDEFSKLPGPELIKRKIGALYVMAPYFNERGEFQRSPNFTNSPAAAVDFIERWPTPIRFGEGNLGHRHFIGARLKETPKENPARIAFEAYAGGKVEDRHCADPTTVLYAVRGARYFGEVGPGACVVRPADGYTRWDAQTDRGHFYNTQKMEIEELERVMEELAIRKPKKK